MNAPIPETAAFSSNLLHGFAHVSIIWPDTAIAHTRPINLQNMTRPSLAHPMLFAEVAHSFPLLNGRYHFREATSFSMALFEHLEPRRVFRRLICLSYAAMSDLSRAA